MKIVTFLAVPAALTLVLASTAGVAQGKPAAAAQDKSGASATVSPKAATARSASQLKPAASKSLQSTGSKPGTPEALRSTPAAEGAHEGCHSKESDA